MDRLVCGDVGFGKTEVALQGRLRRGAGRLPGGRGGADDAARAAALRHLHGALQGPARAHRPGLAPGRGQGPRRRQGRHQGRQHRHRRRHARAARQGDRLQAAGAAGGRRGAAFRRRPQGAPEAAARGRARAHPDGHADPAHAAAGPVRRARAVADHHPAGRPPRRAHLHLAVRSRDRPRGVAARALPRRADASTWCRASPISRRSASSWPRRRRSSRSRAPTASCHRACWRTS